MKRTMTNAEIVGTIRIMGDESGQDIFKARLPIKLLYALRRSYTAVANAYKDYEATLIDICAQYGITPKEAEEKKGTPECYRDIQELLDTKAEVEIHTVPESILDELNDPRYDALSFNQLDRLSWILEKGNEKESKEMAEVKNANEAAAGKKHKK